MYGTSIIDIPDSPEFCAAEMQKMCWKNALYTFFKMHSRNAKTALENAKTALRYNFLHWCLNNNENLMLEKENEAENTLYSASISNQPYFAKQLKYV